MPPTSSPGLSTREPRYAEKTARTVEASADLPARRPAREMDMRTDGEPHRGTLRRVDHKVMEFAASLTRPDHEDPEGRTGKWGC